VGGFSARLSPGSPVQRSSGARTAPRAHTELQQRAGACHRVPTTPKARTAPSLLHFLAALHCHWMKFCASTPLCGCRPPFAPGRAADWQDVSWAGPRAPHQASRRCIARKRPCLRPERAVLSQARIRLVSYALQQAVVEPARGRRAGPQRCLHARCQGAKVWATGWNKVEGLPRGEPEAPKRSGRCSTAHFLCTGPFAAAVAGASQVQHISSNIPPGCCSAVEARLLAAAHRGLRRAFKAAVQPHLSRERVPEAPKLYFRQ